MHFFDRTGSFYSFPLMKSNFSHVKICLTSPHTKSLTPGSEVAALGYKKSARAMPHSAASTIIIHLVFIIFPFTLLLSFENHS